MDKLKVGVKNVGLGSAERRLRQALARRRCTMLAVGPMSKNCVDAVLELRNETSVPLTLIASRRQIEASDLGGGYVNNWSTETFAAYVRERDPGGQVLLARDHGGPWQNDAEVKQELTLAAAMESCKRSYEVDILAGFDVIHLDPSIDIHKTDVSQEELLERLFELYQFCESVARKQGRHLMYEIGTEEQSGDQQDVEELAVWLRKVRGYCAENNLPMPFFAVVQTGTKVRETVNVGNLSDPHRVRGLVPPEVQIANLVEICEQFGINLKEHNTDYLSDSVLGWHPRAGIHAANVAPEFGVAETLQLLRVCEEFGLSREREEFLQLAYRSGKWQKWLAEPSAAGDYEKSVIAGHYVLASPKFVDIKSRIAARCRRSGFDLDASIKACLRHTMRRYLRAFNLLDR